MEFEGDSSVWPWNLVLLLDCHATLLILFVVRVPTDQGIQGKF